MSLTSLQSRIASPSLPISILDSHERSRSGRAGTTDIDDLFVLVGLFADPKFRARNVVIGQYLGIGALVAVSAVAALIALVLPSAYIGLLGAVPIALGIKRLFDLWGKRDGSEKERELERHAGTSALSQLLSVAAITFANGADNIGVYTPVFAVYSGVALAVIVSVFALMTAVWCVLAHWLVHHRTLGAPIRRYGHRALPFVLVGLGLFIMLEAGTFNLLSPT